MQRFQAIHTEATAQPALFSHLTYITPILHTCFILCRSFRPHIKATAQPALFPYTPILHTTCFILCRGFRLYYCAHIPARFISTPDLHYAYIIPSIFYSVQRFQTIPTEVTAQPVLFPHLTYITLTLLPTCFSLYTQKLQAIATEATAQPVLFPHLTYSTPNHLAYNVYALFYAEVADYTY